MNRETDRLSVRFYGQPTDREKIKAAEQIALYLPLGIIAGFIVGLVLIA